MLMGRPIVPILNGPYGGGGPRILRKSIKRIGKKYDMCRANAWSEMSALKAVALAMYIKERHVTIVPTRSRALSGSLRVGCT
jgi:hypothetical protein